MKNKVKIFFYYLLLLIVTYPLFLFFAVIQGYGDWPKTLKEFIIGGIIEVVAGACLAVLLKSMPDKGEKRINKLENNFKFLVLDFNFRILEKTILTISNDYIQIIYTNDFYKITISGSDNIRIIIQYAETLAVYCDKKDFFDDSQEEHSYKEILNESKKWLQNVLISKLNIERKK